jgi:hypothetical protein
MPGTRNVSRDSKFWNPSRNYRYSFSGSDARIWAFYDSAPEIIRPLEAVSTISISIHESKGQARALGHRGIKGLARGVRTIAGSIIFTVIEDNPLRPLMENLNDLAGFRGFKDPGWSIDRNSLGTGTSIDGTIFNNRIAPLLPPTNLLAQYVSEAAAWTDAGITSTDVNGRRSLREQFGIEGAAWLLRGVEFLDEGIVTSVHDIVTEVTVSFIACDFKPIASQIFENDQPTSLISISEDERKAMALEERVKNGHGDGGAERAFKQKKERMRKNSRERGTSFDPNDMFNEDTR